MNCHTLIWNERWKAISSTMFNLGSALFIATIAQIWAKSDLDFPTASWLIGALALFFAGHKILELLEVEP